MSYWKNVIKNSSGFDEYIYNGQKKYNIFMTNKESGWKIFGAIQIEAAGAGKYGKGFAVVAAEGGFSSIFRIHRMNEFTGYANNLNKLSLKFKEKISKFIINN
ncbi:MAG: hypothetical protein LKE46_08155 [Clostridium sp.]|jgi:methyl-accepting chemotaxis protein|uniref:hypothetical protein n=1 Tax=Clostridium sp. TaxID=1506 RepID=UPI0025BC9811|nr:hypothetical protein [Clostridium sp.]MCH3964238.1 hypothetical protein [Clostridium sp.]MCI1715418.1 hypothetical protein [Clostridium sp.]MCI1799791.1 hypothetical protein [Clostridium sp.]MCI1813601.1 hypothetical protein [Clostridium sp.]MCI1870608.1 hypothetical protein [Clostridium sp.]